jgi:hypothetical protein
VKRGVREHQADLVGAGRDRRRKRRIRPSLDEDDWRRRRIQQCFVAVRENGQRASGLNRVDHDGKRFVLAPFDFAQPRDRGLVLGITSEMRSTESENRDHAAVSQNCGCLLDAISFATGAAERIAEQFKPCSWPALRACDWLGAKSAIRRVVIFARAVGAHPKPAKGCPFSIVGMRFYDGKSRAALRTVDEWIAKATVSRIEKFHPTCGTHREVGGNDACSDAARAGKGTELVVAAARSRTNFNFVD